MPTVHQPASTVPQLFQNSLFPPPLRLTSWTDQTTKPNNGQITPYTFLATLFSVCFERVMDFDQACTGRATSPWDALRSLLPPFLGPSSWTPRRTTPIGTGWSQRLYEPRSPPSPSVTDLNTVTSVLRFALRPGRGIFSFWTLEIYCSFCGLWFASSSMSIWHMCL